MDLKALQSVLGQLETEKKISREEILGAIEDGLAHAYKKDYGKKDQIIRAKFNINTGDAEFFQIKIVVDESMLKDESESEGGLEMAGDESSDGVRKIRFNPERHIMIDDARKIKKDVKLEEEISFSLETKEDYGRIAAQTAKQVIIQKIREAERVSVFGEFKGMEGEIVSGLVQRVDNNNVFVEIGRTVAVLPKDEQIRGERYRMGERIKALLFSVEEGARGVNLYLSRSHPKFILKLFELEVPEIASGAVEVKSIAREAGSRSKLAVLAKEDVDPVGSCVGQKGTRVNTVITELGGEKIDIIEWSADPVQFIINALSPAKIVKVEIISNDGNSKEARVIVSEDQFSLAIGKGGQNVRLAAKLTGWKIDIRSSDGKPLVSATEDGEVVENSESLDSGEIEE